MHHSRSLVSLPLVLCVAFVVAQLAYSLPTAAPTGALQQQHVEVSSKSQQHHSSADSKKESNHNQIIAATSGGSTSHSSAKTTTALATGTHTSVSITSHPNNNQQATAQTNAKATTGGAHHAPAQVTVTGDSKATNVSHLSTLINAVPASAQASKAGGLHCGDAPVGKFCKYLSPVCESLDTINAEQTFRLQTQFKSFVEKTANKLSLCFMEQYQFDPNLVPITKEDVTKVCTSRNLAPESKGSYGKFEKCATSNWDVALEKELDRINSARDSGSKDQKHDHKSTGGSHILSQDEDSVVVFNDVVSKILDAKTPIADFKVLNVNSNGKQEADAIAAASAMGDGKNRVSVAQGSHNQQPIITQEDSKSSSNGVPKTQAEANRMFNNPNTVVVLVDESNSRSAASGAKSVTLSSTNGGQGSKSNLTSHRTAVHSIQASVGSTSAPTLSATKPRDHVEDLGEKIMASLAEPALNGGTASSTTGRPSNHHSTGKPEASSSTTNSGSTRASVSTPAPSASTARPSTAPSTKAPQSRAAPETSAAPAAGSTTSKPGESKEATAAQPSTTSAPATAGGSKSTKAPTKDGPTTKAPAENGSTSKAPAKEEPTTKAPAKEEPTTKAPAKEGSTSKAPAKDGSTTKTPAKEGSTTKAPEAGSKSSDLKSGSSTTKKPNGSEDSDSVLGDLTKKASKLKKGVEEKLEKGKKEVSKVVKKVTGEDSDSKSGSKSSVSSHDKGHKSDGRLHQLEHDRQMAIDPIGHTIKHQQYAAAKAAKSNQ